MSHFMATVHEESAEGQLDQSSERDNRENENPAKRNKRFQLFMELMETEHNYVQVLEMIKEEFKKPLEKLLNKHSSHLLFDRIESLIPIHLQIYNALQALEKQWNNRNLVGQVYATVKEHLEKVYVPYMNSYNQIEDLLRSMRCDPHMYEVLRECEQRNAKKYNATDLFIRPVQRLPSVTLILKEMQRATQKNNPDYPWLSKALEVLDDILMQSNQRRKETDAFSETLKIFNKIDDLPPDLINSSRIFYGQVELRVRATGAVFKKYKDRDLTFFLFNDFVAITKRRSGMNEMNASLRLSTSTLNSAISERLNTSSSFRASAATLTRNISFSTLGRRDRKPYKHLDSLRFSSFRQLMYIRSEGIFYLKLRDEKCEDMCALQIVGDGNHVTDGVEFFDKLCDLVRIKDSPGKNLQITATSKREIALQEVNKDLITDVDHSNTGLDLDDRTFMMKSIPPDSRSMGTFRRPSQLRRTVSNASLNLSRIFSKSKVFHPAH